jgi:hypothetical protein
MTNLERFFFFKQVKEIVVGYACGLAPAESIYKFSELRVVQFESKLFNNLAELSFRYLSVSILQSNKFILLKETK